MSHVNIPAVIEEQLFAAPFLSLVDRELVKEFAFDPAQPRDEDGKWVSTARTALDQIETHKQGRRIAAGKVFDKEPLAPEVADQIINSINKKSGARKVVDLDPRKLQPSQDVLVTPNIRQMLNNWKDVQASSVDDPPQVVRSRKHGLVLIDGHHRVALSLLAGDRKIKAALFTKEVP